MNPLILNLAPTGMVPTRAHSPHVPLSVEEIIADVACCARLGASMVHLHARDEDGVPSQDAGIFAEIIARIRADTPNLVIISTTSGRMASEPMQRAATLFLEGDAKPDMASLTLGSMNFSSTASVNAPATIMQLAGIMQERGIKPELEVFDLGMVNFAKVLIAKGLLTPPYYFNILLGNPATAQMNLLHLAAIIADLPAQSYWSLAGIGRFQTQANGLGVVLADGVRTGLEDNLWLDDARTELASNAQLVSRIAAQAAALGRPLASCAQTRTLLGLAQA
jgi:3-keto-5-aminohexanoate cleavage enzyme